MNETKLTGETPDIAEENIQKLKTIFPDVFAEGKVDFEKLQQVLGEYIDTESERYNFSWNGKAKALRLAQTPSTGTLRPCKEESKDWDTTQNLYIEGDNLEVLKLLQKSYHRKIKIIYIDPPYNTGSDFVYPDNFSDSIDNYKKITEQTDADGNNISSNGETNGRYHTDWLNMMYPRLRLARNLLSDDGVIFISIDDHEQENLRKVCDEVFGEENFVSCFIWQKRTSPDARLAISTGHEYILLYAKNIGNFKKVVKTLPLTPEQRDTYKNPDNDPRGPWVSSDFTAQIGHATPQQFYTIKAPNGTEYVPPQGTCWKNIESVFLQKLAEGRFWFGKDGNAFPRRKTYLNESNGRTVWTWWTNKEVGHTQEATKELKDLMSLVVIFDNPKPTKLITRILQLITNKGDLVLDFFSGSATTAHAVMQLNAQDSGNRKFMMVQLPELPGEKTEAYKAGYKNICEIGKERIRRAGDKIREEAGLTAPNLDIGFKVFKLDSSNIKKWQPSYDNLESSLIDHINNYVDGRSELDVVYEIILKCGLNLTYAIDEYTFADQKIYSIGFGALMICLDDNITTAVADGMVKLKHELKPETWKVVFKDNGFHNDSNKTNVKEILKCGGLEDDAFTTL